VLDSGADELDSGADELDSGADELDSGADELDSGELDGAWVSVAVVFADSTGVVAVLVSAVVVACVGAACSVVDVCTFFAALAVLPGKACAASSVKAPVSVAEPASSQRLQRPKRRRAVSRDRLDVGVVMGIYSPP